MLDHKTIDYEFLVKTVHSYIHTGYGHWTIDEYIKTEILTKHPEISIDEINREWRKISIILLDLSPTYNYINTLSQQYKGLL
jgi:hypothetical protein